MCVEHQACKMAILTRIARAERIIPFQLLFLLIACIGCADTGGRIALSGVVTLDGEPLPEGAIEFHPRQGTGGPSSGGEIAGGQFSIAAERSVFPGVFRVEITANRGTGKKQIYEITGEEFEIRAQYLPARYNRQSELSAQVAKSGKNYFEYHLESAGP